MLSYERRHLPDILWYHKREPGGGAPGARPPQVFDFLLLESDPGNATDFLLLQSDNGSQTDGLLLEGPFIPPPPNLVLLESGAPNIALLESDTNGTQGVKLE